MGDERHEWICKRAYALWEEGGRQNGQDYDNWLRATADRALMEATRASSDGSEVLQRTQRPVARETQVVKSCEKVLVVDDEAEIRFNTVAVLEDAGYEAFEAANASEALIWLQNHDAKAVVTDVNMPGHMDGIGIASKIRAEWPKTKIIITSGLVHLRASDMAENVTFLAKPVRYQSLLEVFDS
jgi:CheY-like chemotaxis protein